MALVHISIRDGSEDDTVDIRLESEPSIPLKDGEPDLDEMTPAQIHALGMINHSVSYARESTFEVEESDD